MRCFNPKNFIFSGPAISSVVTFYALYFFLDFFLKHLSFAFQPI